MFDVLSNAPAGLGARSRRRLMSIAFALGLIGLILPVWAQDVPRPHALYLTMRDGTRIAVDVWLPQEREPDAPLPTILRMTRYWRAHAFLHSELEMDNNQDEADTFNQAGYALVLVDARGSGASFGHRISPWSHDEILDYGEIVDWIIAQPWSNGLVGAYGDSYDGNTAVLLSTLSHPAVKAIAPRFYDFDPFAYLTFPGGIFTEQFVQAWSQTNQILDANDVCALHEVEGELCDLLRALQAQQPDLDANEACRLLELEEEDCDALKQTPLDVKPADNDDGSELAAAIQQHTENIDVYATASAITYRDDTFGNTNLTMADFSPYRFQQVLAASGVAFYTWGSWLDAGTADSALSQYATLSNPQHIVIGPWNHGAEHDANPFLPPETPVVPDIETQQQDIIDFFDLYLTSGAQSQPASSQITYFTLGENAWKTTATWPPVHTTMQRWYVEAQGSLSQEPPTAVSGADPYTVNFDATTGPHNRWHTQLGQDVIYLDRAVEDANLLTYTSAPLEADTEITGHPVVTLYITSTATDGAFYVYLETVNPEGHVTYITEGQLRALHRRVSMEAPPYVRFGPNRSFNREDHAPLVPGEVTELHFSLLPTSVLIPQGHRIRIAIAGHDAETFVRIPAVETPTITIERNAVNASHIDLPMASRP